MQSNPSLENFYFVVCLSLSLSGYACYCQEFAVFATFYAARVHRKKFHHFMSFGSIVPEINEKLEEHEGERERERGGDCDLFMLELRWAVFASVCALNYTMYISCFVALHQSIQIYFTLAQYTHSWLFNFSSCFLYVFYLCRSAKNTQQIIRNDLPSQFRATTPSSSNHKRKQFVMTWTIHVIWMVY